MKRAVGFALAFAIIPNLYGQISVVQQIPQTATIDVYAAKASDHLIPRTIFGSFLEPIGNSTYNGLWAEILQNPSLESGLWSASNVAEMLRERPELRRASELALPLPWEPLDPGQGNRYEIHYGAAANSWQSLQVFGVSGEPTGIKQKVYLPIHRTRDYVGSFYARHLSGEQGLKIAIDTREGREELASQDLTATSDEWTRYEFRLHIPEGKLHRLDPADFVVQLKGSERVELDNFSLMPADAINGLDQDPVAMAKEMHTPLVRFGGNFTSAYHWTDGIGPPDKRVSMRNVSWGIPEYNTFGTDEFLEFCRQIGAEPQIALNLGSGTPKEAAAWVHYVNEHWHTHSGLTWELGNELWGNWNLGYPTHEELAARTKAFSDAVRAVDPSAHLIATGADPDNFREWNEIELTNPPGTFEDLSAHFVVNPGDVVMKNPTPDFIEEAAFAMPVGLGRELHEEQAQIDGTAGYAGKAHIAFTEWLFVGNRDGAPNFTNAGGSIITAGFFNMLMRDSAIVPISDMTGIMEFAGIWKKRSQVYVSPAYHVFKLYANADVARTVDVETDAGMYSVVQGVRRIPEIASVPYLDVVAALSADGKKLTLFCVNRSLDTDISTRISLHDFPSSRRASIETLYFHSLADANDEVNPDRVKPTQTTETTESGSWMHAFPSSSVTVMTIGRD